MEIIHQGSRIRAIAMMAIMLSVAVYCMASIPARGSTGTQSDPIPDPDLVGSIAVSDNIYVGYPMTVSFVLPNLPGRTIENVTLQVEYDSSLHPIYAYNRTSLVSPPNSSFVWVPTDATDSGFVLDVLVLNHTDGMWYSDHDLVWAQPSIPSGMIGGVNATPSDADNSGRSHSVISWTVLRELSFIKEMEFNIFNLDEGVFAFPQNLVLPDVLADTVNFTAVEESGGVHFEYIWTVPYDQVPGEYAFNVTATDLNGHTESWTGPIINVTWDQRPPILLNGTITMIEDTLLEIDLSDRFKEVNGDPLSFFLGDTSGNIKLDLNGSILSIAPRANWNGSEALTLNVNDGHSNLSHVMTAEVRGINDAPYPLNSSMAIDWNKETMIIFWLLFTDPERDEIEFSFVGAGPHLDAVYDPEQAELSLTPDDGYSGRTYFIVNATDGIAGMIYNITVDVTIPDHFVSLRVVYEDAGDHIPQIPPSLRPIRVTLSNGSLNYTIVVTEFEGQTLSASEGTYEFKVELLIPKEFTYNAALKRSGYESRSFPDLELRSDKDLPLSIPWIEYQEPEASWDDILFEGTFMNRTEGEWTITVPTSGNKTGYPDIHLQLVVVNDPEKNETLRFDFFWDEARRSFVLELKKVDLQEFETGELSYYFTDGDHRTEYNQTVFITKDSRENSIVVIAILVALIILVMIALVLIMRKPAEEEESESLARSEDRPCPSCGERSQKDEKVCPNCGSNMEE